MGGPFEEETQRRSLSEKREKAMHALQKGPSRRGSDEDKTLRWDSKDIRRIATEARTAGARGGRVRAEVRG